MKMKTKLLLILLISISGISNAQYAKLRDFNYTDGAYPTGAMTFAGNKLYGMAWYGGADSVGNIFSINLDGTGYKDLFDFNIQVKK